jgi:DNA-directed RNA polymerase subunit RPC12/RpoP
MATKECKICKNKFHSNSAIKFCSDECRVLSKTFLSETVNCISCSKSFLLTKPKVPYKCVECKTIERDIINTQTCERCSKKFIVKDRHKINRGQYRFCSYRCGKLKYTIDDEYFKNIDENKSYWLGIIWACGYIYSSDFVKITAPKDLLERLLIELKCNYNIKKSHYDKYFVKIYSSILVDDLLNLNLSTNMLIHEWPYILYSDDFIRGYKDSNMCEVVGDDIILSIPSKNLMREFYNRIGGVITYKNTYLLSNKVK